MKRRKSIKEYFFWNKDHTGWLMDNLFFFLFIGFLGIVYIANAHYAEKQVRKIRVVEKDVRRMNRVHMALLAKIMDETKHAAVENDVKNKGLKPPQQRPYRIVSN